MNATERIEKLLNCVGSTIADVDKTYSEETRKKIGDLLRKNVRSPYDEIAYLSNIIVRLESALSFTIKELNAAKAQTDDTLYIDPEMADPTVFSDDDPVEITDEIAAQLEFPD